MRYCTDRRDGRPATKEMQPARIRGMRRAQRRRRRPRAGGTAVGAVTPTTGWGHGRWRWMWREWVVAVVANRGGVAAVEARTATTRRTTAAVRRSRLEPGGA